MLSVTPDIGLPRRTNATKMVKRDALAKELNKVKVSSLTAYAASSEKHASECVIKLAARAALRMVQSGSQRNL